MSNPQENEIRSIWVDGLPPMTDAIYLFSYFHDNAKVLVATVLRNRRRRVRLDYGFVEFASHEDAEFVLESYNGERMLNFNHVRFRLSRDTDHMATMWRWSHAYRRCSFFGYDDLGKDRDLRTVIKESPPCVMKKRSYLHFAWGSYDSEVALTNYTENQPDHTKLIPARGGLSSAGYMEIDVDKHLKLMDIPLAHPNMYQGYARPNLKIQQNQPGPMQREGGFGVVYVKRPHHQKSHTLDRLVLFIPPPDGKVLIQWNLGSDVHTLGQLTQVHNENLETGPSMKKEKEKELCLCFEEYNS